MSVNASAPGSLMLLGEYAVLQGKHALVCAVDKRMHVLLTPRQDQQIILQSTLGEYQTTLSQLQSVPPFQFILAALRQLKKYLSHGYTLQIEAEFSATMGFASSAAVTVATLAALLQSCKVSYTPIDLIKLARRVVRSVQGLGSGADVAACVLGGIVLYRATPFHAEKLLAAFPLTAIYSGHKTPTVTAVNYVKQQFAAHPQLFKQLCQTMDGCVLAGADAIRASDWPQLGKLFNLQQGLLDALGVNTWTIQQIVQWLRQQPAMLGAKISGSGLGDCVIGLGTRSVEQSPAFASGVENIALQITQQGVQCETI